MVTILKESYLLSNLHMVLDNKINLQIYYEFKEMEIQVSLQR